MLSDDLKAVADAAGSTGSAAAAAQAAYNESIAAGNSTDTAAAAAQAAAQATYNDSIAGNGPLIPDDAWPWIIGSIGIVAVIAFIKRKK